MRLSKSLKQLITQTARDAYAKGVADGEKRLLTGLKAVAQLNGSAERLLKGGWDEGKHPRAADGRFGDKPGDHSRDRSDIADDEPVEVYDTRTGEVAWEGTHADAKQLLADALREDGPAGVEGVAIRRPGEARGNHKPAAKPADPGDTADRLPPPSDYHEFETGEPLIATVYRGEAAGGSGSGMAALGHGRYFGLEPAVAERFSKRGTVQAGRVSLERPVVVRSDDDMAALKLRAERLTGKDFGRRGNNYTGFLHGDQPAAFTAALQQMGYDGIVVTYKEAPGGQQLVKFPPPERSGFAKAVLRKAATVEPDDSHALIVSAMLQVAEDAADTGDDPADALRALADLSQDPDRLREVLAGGTLQKAWDESLHPRDHGKFSSKPGAAGRSDGSGLDDSGNDLTDRPRSRSQAEAAAGVIRDILMGECDGDTKDWCVTTAEAVRAAFPDAEVWDGDYDGDGDQAHTIFKLGDWFIDVTADQFGGPDVFVARELPEDTYPDFAPTEAGRPAEVGRRMAAAMRAKFARRLEKAWDESLHPRDDSGRFIGKDKLQAAKSDPALAKQLRDKTTDPGERAKLDRVLSGEADPGRTKRGEQRHQSQQKRAATESDRRRAHRLAMRAFEPGGLGYDDFEELADLLPSLTVEQLRSVRAAVGASWGGQRLRRQGMVDTLVAFARQQAAPPEQDAPGSPGWAARMMNREDEPSARVDAWESAKVDDAADRAERMGRWEADRPDSEAAGAVAGAARADLAGARGWAGEVATATPKPPLPSPDVPEPAARPKPRPKKRDRRKPVRTLADAVRRAGGINPASPEFLRFFANAHEAVEYGIPLNLFNRETGRHPDQLVTELISEGHLTVPDGADTTQYLFDQMVKGATSEHAILDEAKGKYLADLAREQDEYEAEHGTPPDAYEGGTLGADDLFAEEDSGHRGAAGAAGEVPDGGEGSELGDFLGDGDALAFDFGANAEPDAGPVEPQPYSNNTPVQTPAGPKSVGDLTSEWRAKLGKRFGGVSLKWYGSPGDESPQVEVYSAHDGYHGKTKKLVATYQPAGPVDKPERMKQRDAERARRNAEYEAKYAGEESEGIPPEATAAAEQPAPAEPPMADPLMGRDAQLDIFGGSKRTPRPAKPAVKQSLVPREVERRVEGEETQRAIEAMRDAGNPPEGPHPASVPADVPQGGGQDFYSTLGRDAQRHAVLGRKLATAGALLPVEAVDYATGDGSRHVTAGRAEVVLTNRLGLTAADAKSLLAKIKPATTLTVGGNRKRPGYDVLDLFRAAGKLYEPPAGNNPESGHTPPPPANSPVTGQSGPDTGGEPNGRGQRLSDEVRGGAGGRGGAGVGAGDGPSPGDAPRPPGGSPTGEPAPAGGRPGNRGAGGGPGGGRPGGVAAGGAGAGGGPGGRGPAGGTVPPADGPGGGGGPGRADGGGEVALPALTAPTPYGPQAVVSRGGLVVRDGTKGVPTPVYFALRYGSGQGLESEGGHATPQDAAKAAGSLGYVMDQAGNVFRYANGKRKKITAAAHTPLGRLAYALRTGKYTDGAEAVGIDPPDVTPLWRQTAAARESDYNRSGDTFTDYDRAAHRSAVRTAMLLGKPVPPEVLADYPDLSPGSPSEPAATAAEKPASKPGQFAVGQPVVWASRTGPAPAEYRGKQMGDDGWAATVIVRNPGEPPYQTTVPLSQLSHPPVK